MKPKKISLVVSLIGIIGLVISLFLPGDLMISTMNVRMGLIFLFILVAVMPKYLEERKQKKLEEEEDESVGTD